MPKYRVALGFPEVPRAYEHDAIEAENMAAAVRIALALPLELADGQGKQGAAPNHQTTFRPTHAVVMARDNPDADATMYDLNYGGLTAIRLHTPASDPAYPTKAIELLIAKAKWLASYYEAAVKTDYHFPFDLPLPRE